MGVISKFKEMIGIDDGDDDNIAEEEEEKKEESNTFITGIRPPEDRIMRSGFMSTVPSSSSMSLTPSAPPVSKSNEGRVLTQTGRYTNWKVEVTEPQEFDDSPRLVDSLKARKLVIINLENLETETARKIFDFLSGATYALNGNVQKINNNIFVFATDNVDVSHNANRKVKEAENGYKNPWT